MGKQDTDTICYIWATFEPVVFKVILGSFGALFSKWPVTRKRTLVERNSEISASLILVTHVWGTFDLVGFKVILGSFGTLFSKWLVTRKRLIVE